MGFDPDDGTDARLGWTALPEGASSITGFPAYLHGSNRRQADTVRTGFRGSVLSAHGNGAGLSDCAVLGRKASQATSRHDNWSGR